MKPKSLYRTTIVVWSENPTNFMDLETIGYEAISGEMYCDSQKCELVENTDEFPDTEFFDS